MGKLVPQSCVNSNCPGHRTIRNGQLRHIGFQSSRDFLSGLEHGHSREARKPCLYSLTISLALGQPEILAEYYSLFTITRGHHSCLILSLSNE